MTVIFTLFLYVSTFVTVTHKSKMSLWHFPHIYNVARVISCGGHIATSGYRLLSQSFGNSF